MVVLFSIETLETGEKDVRALLCSEDTSYRQTSLDTIIKTIKSFIPEEKRKKIKFHKEYIGNEKINGTSYKTNGEPKETFAILVKLIDGEPTDILKIDEENYHLQDYCELLNKEVDDEHKTYKIFNVPGELV